MVMNSVFMMSSIYIQPNVHGIQDYQFIISPPKAVSFNNKHSQQYTHLLTNSNNSYMSARYIHSNTFMGLPISGTIYGGDPPHVFFTKDIIVH